MKFSKFKFLTKVQTFNIFSEIIARGGSRILHRRGRQPSREGAPSYDFVKFSEKLHEIEKILDRGGARAGSAPP